MSSFLIAEIGTSHNGTNGLEAMKAAGYPMMLEDTHASVRALRSALPKSVVMRALLGNYGELGV